MKSRLQPIQWMATFTLRLQYQDTLLLFGAPELKQLLIKSNVVNGVWGNAQSVLIEMLMLVSKYNVINT